MRSPTITRMVSVQVRLEPTQQVPFNPFLLINKVFRFPCHTAVGLQFHCFISGPEISVSNRTSEISCGADGR